MTILFHLSSLNKLGGIERSIINRCNYLVNRHHDVYILCTEPTDVNGYMVLPLDPRVKVIDCSQPMESAKPGFGYRLKWNLMKLKQLWAINRVISKIRPDILTRRGDVILLALFLVPHHGAKFVSEWSTTIDRNEIPSNYNFWLKWMSWHVDKHVFLVRHDLKIFPGPPQKAIVIPTAVEVPKTCSRLTEKIVITTTRLEPIKNNSLLITAWGLVAAKHPDWQLHIYGDGSQYHELLQLIDRLNLNGKVILKGKTSDVHSALLNASIFALASKGEGFSNSILEAIAHGLPIVVTETHCSNDLMDGYEIGYQVPQNNSEQLAAGINELIENEPKRKQMGANAYQRSFDYDINIIFVQYENLYQELIAKKGH